MVRVVAEEEDLGARAALMAPMQATAAIMVREAEEEEEEKVPQGTAPEEAACRASS